MRYLRWLFIGTLVAFAIYHLSPHFADFKQIPTLLESANYFRLLASAFSIVAQYFGDGWLSQILLAITGHKINFKLTVKIASIDVFAAHLLPIGEAGVIATSAYFYKKLGVTNQGIIFLTAAWSIITNVVLVILLLISLAFLPRLPNVPIHISDIAKIIIILILLFLTLAMFFGKSLHRFLAEKLSKYPIFQEIRKFIGELSIYKQNILANKLLLAKAMLASLIYFSANILSLYLCFMAFHYYPNIALVAATYLFSLIVSFITLTPAGIGTAEAIMILLFLQFNLDPVTATASVLVFRIFSFWLPIPAGAIAYFSLKNHKR